MNLRQRIGLAVMMYGQIIVAVLAKWIIGHDGATPELMRAIISQAKTYTAEMPQNTARKGLAREASELNDLMGKMAASIRPDSHWRFHKATIGPVEIVVLPQIIDSNTGVVTATEDPAIMLGTVITTDGNPPNCDPAALNEILQSPREATA
jgi:hypothetical protein